MARQRWKDVNAIYQIYPRSFRDSDGDGVGDLRGVIEQLDYIRGRDDSLGIGAVWFSPFYKSPQADMGYDVSDYCDIDPQYGTLDDFRNLLAEAHHRGIKVMVDFVPNHTSNQHPWFAESRTSRDNAKADYYVWRDPKPDGSPPNNWISIFGGPAWEWNEERKQYYLHTFLKEQPDLNWDNPAVRKEMQNVIRFWLELGVDGFRADAVRWMSKDPGLRDDPVSPFFHGDKPVEFDDLQHRYSRFGPKLFDYLRELTDVVAEFPDAIMVFEDYPDSLYSTEEQYLGFYGVNPEVSMPFNFEGLGAQFYADAFRTLVNEFQGMIDPDKHTPVYCFSNHDQHRIVTRYGGEEPARLIALMQMTLPGLPVVYYGDELGMPNTEISWDQVRDLSVFSSNDLSVGRDPERTPMQWHNGPGAGFTDADPWLPIGATVATHNVQTELHEPDSFLSLYRRLLRLRSQYAILRHGTYKPSGELDVDIFMYERWLEKQHIFIALNFGSKPRTVKLPHSGRVLCTTHPVDYPEVATDGSIDLRAYEGVLVECCEHPIVGD